MLNKVTLYKHQERALKRVRGLKNVAFYLDMGLGKTFVASEQAKIFDNDINLVICQKSKIDDWAEHFKKFYDLEVFPIEKKTDVVKFLKFKNKKVAVINYAKVHRENYSLDTLKDFTLIIDESSVLGNPKTELVKAVRKFKYNNLILLSGTPTSGKYEKLWTQLNMLGWEIKESKYKQQFLNQKLIKRFGRTFYEIDKQDPYKNIDRLKRKMRENGCVFMKTEEVFDLPEKTFIDIKVDNDSNYKTFDKDWIVKINDTKIIGDTSLKRMLGKRQLTSIYNKNKQDTLKDLIESTEDRIIIFYNFEQELETIKKCIPKDRPLSFVNGSIKDKYNYENHSNSITLMQYQSGAKGHNLQKANKLIFYSPTLICEDYMQSIKRIHRIGQERPAFYYRLIVKDSIEEDIYKTLEKGEDYTNELFDRKEI